MKRFGILLKFSDKSMHNLEMKKPATKYRSLKTEKKKPCDYLEGSSLCRDEHCSET